jgi:hypothetical protein
MPHFEKVTFAKAHPEPGRLFFRRRHPHMDIFAFLGYTNQIRGALHKGHLQKLKFLGVT